MSKFTTLNSDTQKLLKNPKVSVVIVSFKSGHEFYSCLQSLTEQNTDNFETIVVDNGNIVLDRIKNPNMKYINMGGNAGPSRARNVGTKIAKGEIVAFLDDDAVAHPDWVKNIAKVMKDSEVIAIRGKIIPKNGKNILNKLQTHYDMGVKTIEHYVSLEGNSAFRRSIFIKSKGFQEDLFGHEGIELSYRLSVSFPHKKILYVPNVVIYHEYADSLAHLLRKSYRHGKKRLSIDSRFPDLPRYVDHYNQINSKISSPLTIRLKLLDFSMRIAEKIGACSYYISHFIQQQNFIPRKIN